MQFASILRLPDFVTVETRSGTENFPCTGPELRTEEGVSVSLILENSALSVRLQADKTPVRCLGLRWNTPMPEGADYCGDAWERSYGELEWRHLLPHRFMPWYFLASLNGETRGYGVMVRCGAMCFWQADDRGVTLWMDVRSGGEGVILGGRQLNCAAVVTRDYEEISAFDAACDFCGQMCTDPLLPKEPVYGSNNWYYAYGWSSQEELIRDTELLAQLTQGLENRPYMVVDSCWQSETTRQDGCAGGPWTQGNERFPDMPGLAREIKARGARPGIWMRLLKSADPEIPETWRQTEHPELLDPSLDEVLEHIAADVRRMADWGYELLKYDFSTYDIFGKWGIHMNPSCTRDGWHFRNRSRTNAEIAVNFYRTVHEAAPEMVIIGCNCIGHLIAGLAHLNRIGDDTSGYCWERTRRMGVNTLAFRLPQNGRFFMADADCLGILRDIPWELNRQWGQLLASSGTPFFASISPETVTEEEKQALKQFFAAASRQQDVAKPLDWMVTNCPSRWEINGVETHFSWYTETGIPKEEM